MRNTRTEVEIEGGRRFAVQLNPAGEIVSLHQIFERAVLRRGVWVAEGTDYRCISRNHKKRPVLEFKVLAAIAAAKEPA